MSLHSHQELRKQSGSILVLSALTIYMLFAFAALALDSSLLFVARNELQNAADAGALAATRVLYLNNGTAVNPGANQVGHDTAESNDSQNLPVEVDWTGGNAGDVERGHWSFATRQFTPNSSLLAVDIFNYTTAELDADLNFINAVKVTTRRQASPVQSILAGFFGIDSSAMVADAVAYIGFAGRLLPEEVDQPIAMCADSIRDVDGKLQCNVGTFMPSSPDAPLSNTVGWTDFDQDGPNNCGVSGAAGVSTVRPLVCPSPDSGSNQYSLLLGKGMSTMGGQADTVFDDVFSCWEDRTGRITPLSWTLPVVDCPSNNVTACSKLVGAVSLNVIFILDKTGGGNSPNSIDNLAPTEMNCGESCNSWSIDPATPGIERWNSFVNWYELRKPNGDLATYENDGWRQKTIYFLPDCSKQPPAGGTGGENFGILAKIPVLVE